MFVFFIINRQIDRARSSEHLVHPGTLPLAGHGAEVKTNALFFIHVWPLLHLDVATSPINKVILKRTTDIINIIAEVNCVRSYLALNSSIHQVTLNTAIAIKCELLDIRRELKNIPFAKPDFLADTK